MSRILNILLVEDDPINQKVASCIVKRELHNITIAENGSVGVEKYLSEKFDLILMDIQMPEMDGYEATRQIRTFNSEVVIFAQTAYALSGDDEKTIAAGCNDYLTKPIRKEELVALIQKYFQEE